MKGALRVDKWSQTFWSFNFAFRSPISTRASRTRAMADAVIIAFKTKPTTINAMSALWLWLRWWLWRERRGPDGGIASPFGASKALSGPGGSDISLNSIVRWRWRVRKNTIQFWGESCDNRLARSLLSSGFVYGQSCVKSRATKYCT